MIDSPSPTPPPDDLDALARRVGRVVLANRTAQGLSRGALARAAGLSTTIVSRIESGEGNPSMETLWRVSHALGVPLGALLADTSGPSVRRVPQRSGEAMHADSGMTGWLIHAASDAHRAELYDIDMPAGVDQTSVAHLPGSQEVVVCLAGRMLAGPDRRSAGVGSRRCRVVRRRRPAPVRGPRGRPGAELGAVSPTGDRVVREYSQPVVAGIITAVVGFAGAFTIVLAGLAGIGADTGQAASGLTVLCLTQGAVAIWLGLRYRMPISIAWSTPGAALLATAGPIEGGYAAALGAFAFTGVLLVIAGLSRRLGRWIAAIPVPLASAMLAGVLLPLCLAPARAATDLPELALPVIAVWMLAMRFARRYAVPAALLATAAVVLLDPGAGAAVGDDLFPGLDFTTPTLNAQTLIGIGVPLFLVTMASQNIPGMGVLAAFGYRPDLRPVLTTTGAGTILGAPFGGHAINLAAITAALAAGPDADPDPSRRWVASVTAGAVYLVLGLGAGLATALIAACPPILVQAVAGLALIGALAGALTAALASEEHRDAAVVTLVTCASGMSAFGVSSAFWGLLAGLAVLGLRRLPSRP